MINNMKIDRRQFLRYSAALVSGLTLPPVVMASAQPIVKRIPKTSESLPVIGMGTSRTFNAIGDSALMTRLAEVTQTFFDMGGGMIDSSPMYGSSQRAIGQLLPAVKGRKNLFAATKVWIDGHQAGLRQMEQSRIEWGVERFDLMQIHNLVDWQTHLKALQQMKADGQIRYTGITTSHGRYHRQLQEILRKHDFDFVQLSYNIGNLDAEHSLLRIAQDKGIAVIVNRPYQRGELFRRVRGKDLPPWAEEIGCDTWGQYFLKYVVSHPAVSCAIPATSKVRHMQDNMLAGRGILPSSQQRQKMLAYYESL